MQSISRLLAGIVLGAALDDVDLDEGESADIALTPQKPGTYEMHCTHPFHAMLGMKGQIVVR